MTKILKLTSIETTSRGKSEIIDEPCEVNIKVKLAMADELLSAGLPCEAVIRILKLDHSNQKLRERIKASNQSY